LRQLPKLQVKSDEDLLPTLFGRGYDGGYAVRRSNFGLSFLGHAVALALILTTSTWIARHRIAQSARLANGVPLISEYVPFTHTSQAAHGGGGGGDHDKLLASEGRLPKAALNQITPPEVVVRSGPPKLAAEPTLVMPPELNLATNQLPNLGDPRANVVGPASNGTGFAGGIGSGVGGGIGSGKGPGVGPGIGGGIGGGVLRAGFGGVTAPRLIYKPDPEYSTEARQAKYQGTVVVSIIVGPDGRAHDVRVRNALGMGLDEKAVEAVRQWRFEPALKDGRPVAVWVDVEVNFHLY
jgi:TonB family protein